MVIPEGGGEPVVVTSDLLALPSPQEPDVTLYRTAEGLWMLEQSLTVTPLVDQQKFSAGGRGWRFSCPDPQWQTSLATMSVMTVRHVRLIFSVSRDEEHVHVQAANGVHRIDLGDRGHNYLLLTLARQRLSDASQGFPDDACGWMDFERALYEPNMSAEKLNLDVFRIRRHCAAAGIADAATIIERRPRTRQLRLGAGNIEIVTL
jgi:hypothetical protein